MKRALVCVPALFLGACGVEDYFTTTVTFSDEASATVELEMDISGECAGSGTREDEHGVTRWTKTPRGDGEAGTCVIDVTWDGDLISLAKMRTDTIEECGADNEKCNPDELDLSLEITLDAAWFDAGSERMERSQLVTMSGDAMTGGALLFEVDKTTALPLRFGPDDAVKNQLKTAYLVAGSLPVNARGSVELTMVDVRRLQAGSPDGILSFVFRSLLRGSIEGHL